VFDRPKNFSDEPRRAAFVRQAVRWRLGSLIGVVAVLLSSCASWQQTRKETVDPIHELLHHTYPHALESTDPAQVMALFVDGSGAAAPSLELMARFNRIDDARAGIETVDLEQSPSPANVILRVEGISITGEPMSLVQPKHMWVVREAAGWKIARDDRTEVRVDPVPTARFVDDTQLRGLWFQHESRKIEDLHGVPQRFVYGSGVAASDVDGDGWDDLLLLSGDRIELFVNQRGSFLRASQAWGLGTALPGVLTVALTFDFDNDGREDLFVGVERAQPLLFRNVGGAFERVQGSGIETTERTISAVAADFDGDGFLDLFLANHEDVYRNAPDPPGGADNAQPDQLYLNNRDGTFRDFTDEAGVGNTGWSLAPVVADYDDDGDPDLFVGNDFGMDTLYRNDGKAHFVEVAGEIGVDQPSASMSADWGDFDGDGDFDLFVGGMHSGSAWVLEAPGFQVKRVPWLIDAMFRPYVRQAIRAWFRGNRLYENLGDGTFREIVAGSGSENSGWAWGSVWLDFDNDGRLDVYSANGFISGPNEDDI